MSSLAPQPLANYSKALKDFIKSSEMFYAPVYNDGGGVPTVGYGFTLASEDSKHHWSASSENSDLPSSLSTEQKKELDNAIANLNEYGLGAKAKIENDKITGELQKYSLTEAQASKLLDLDIVKAEKVVKRVLTHSFTHISSPA